MSDRLPLPPSTDESAQSRCETSPERPPAILFRLTNLTCRWKNPYELKSHAMDSGIGSGSDAPVRRMVMPTTFILTPFFSWARAPRLCCACLEWSRAEMRESGVLVVNSRVGIVPSCIRVRCVSSCPLSLFCVLPTSDLLHVRSKTMASVTTIVRFGVWTTGPSSHYLPFSFFIVGCDL